ncbi:MAG: hypothetical protein H6720_03505 [Sandaracinus sp.]|nr:hypothetical protein [Sandaracinus sp.]
MVDPLVRSETLNEPVRRYDHFADAEVDQLRLHVGTVAREEDVPRLEVAVDDALFVHEAEGHGDRNENLERLTQGELRLLVKTFTQRLPLEAAPAR